MNEQTLHIEENHLSLSLSCFLPSLPLSYLLLEIKWVYWFDFLWDGRCLAILGSAEEFLTLWVQGTECSIT